MSDLDIKSIISEPNEVNEEDAMRLMIEEILGAVNPDSIISTLQDVSKTAKEEGIDSSYEGNMIAEDGINKLLSGISVNTAIKEQLVMRVEPLKISNLYEHYLMQSRLCGVPIEVFLNAESEEFEIPQPRIEEEEYDSTLSRRVDIGEVFEDYSQNFKSDYRASRTVETEQHVENEIEVSQVVKDIDDFFLDEQEQTLSEEEGVFEEHLNTTTEGQTLQFETEEELEMETETELILPFEDDIVVEDVYNDEPIIFEEESQESHNDTLEEDDITRLMSSVQLDITPVTPTGAGISKTYSLEQIRPITGGSSEI